MKIEVNITCLHALSMPEEELLINDQHFCINCAVELSSKIANELLINNKAVLLYKLLATPLGN